MGQMGFDLSYVQTQDEAAAVCLGVAKKRDSLFNHGHATLT